MCHLPRPRLSSIMEHTLSGAGTRRRVSLLHTGNYTSLHTCRGPAAVIKRGRCTAGGPCITPISSCALIRKKLFKGKNSRDMWSLWQPPRVASQTLSTDSRTETEQTDMQPKCKQIGNQTESDIMVNACACVARDTDKGTSTAPTTCPVLSSGREIKADRF